MSADDIRKIRRNITDLDVKVQTLSESINNVVSGDASRGAQANDQYVTFTNQIQATMAGTIASSVDSIKANLMQDLQAYIDSKVSQVTADIDNKISQAVQQQQQQVDQKIANALVQVNHEIAQALIKQDA